MSYLKSGGSSPFSPSPGHVIGGGSWRVFLGGPHVGTRHFRSATLGGGAAWVAILLARSERSQLLSTLPGQNSKEMLHQT
jgi:hypothetical protein